MNSNTKNNLSIQNEINNIIDSNKISDLNKFIKQRHNLNKCNSYLIYFFYIIQSLGILSTSVSASNNNIELLWIGIGLNMLASLIQIFEKINNTKLQKIYLDIIRIQNGTYVDESAIIDIDQDINPNRDQSYKYKNNNTNNLDNDTDNNTDNDTENNLHKKLISIKTKELNNSNII